MKIELSESENLELQFDTGVIIEGGDYPIYRGATILTPHPYDKQILPTKETVVMSDITFNEIPFSEVSNPQGGYTVNIGGI